MADEATTAPDTRAEMAEKFAALDAEQDQPTEQDTQDTAAQTADTDGAPEGTSAGTEDASDTDAEQADESFTNFRIEDVPEEYREHVEKAYKQLQADYTRKAQSVAEERREAENAMAFIAALQSEDQREAALRQIADAYGGEQALLDILGYETDGPDLDDEPDLDDIDPDDPNAAMRAEWEQFKAFQAQQAAQAEAAQAAQAEEEHLDRIDQSVTDQLKALATKHGEISPEEEQLLIGHALANPPDEDGMPRLADAYNALQASWNARQKRWAQSKETTHVAPDGQAATQVPDLDNERERRDYIAAAVAATDAAIPGN